LQTPVVQPHVMKPPQPFDMVPQLPFVGHAVMGVQHLSVWTSQTWLPVQPHSMTPPQPLETSPQTPFGPFDGHVPVGAQHWVVPGLQTSPLAVHPPQLSEPPHPSETIPQVPAGKSLHCFAVQQDIEPGLHESPFAQLPQVMVLPQPSGYVPQEAPRSLQVNALQPHWFAVPPPPHDCGSVHPQKSVPPQPLSTLPHCPCWQVAGVQHWSVPMLHTWLPLQKLQLSVPPHPSGKVPPHAVPAKDGHVFGVHCVPQMPFELQTSPAPWQVPQ
jgi:hypothetical protein